MKKLSSRDVGSGGPTRRWEPPIGTREPIKPIEPLIEPRARASFAQDEEV